MVISAAAEVTTSESQDIIVFRMKFVFYKCYHFGLLTWYRVGYAAGLSRSTLPLPVYTVTGTTGTPKGAHPCFIGASTGHVCLRGCKINIVNLTH